MVVAFATSDDVAARWRPLSDTETDLADMLCDDASDMIRVRWPDVDDRIAAGTLRQASAARVVAGMVKRAMNIPATGFQSITQTAGPYSTAGTLANPNADLYLTKEEARLFDGETTSAHVGWLV